MFVQEAMKADSEEFCKMRFDTHLRKIIPTSNLLWTDVKQKDEPPDYYLSVDAIQYAVEVTILMQKVSVEAKNHLPVGIIRDLLSKFVKEEVEMVAKNSGYLRGAYLVVFSQPITNFADVKGAIQIELLSYISDTVASRKASRKVIYKNSREGCFIEKLNSEGNKVVMGGPFISKWEGESLAEAKQLLNERLDEKKI